MPKLKSQNSDLEQDSRLDSMKVVVAAEQNGDAHFPADARLREHANGNHVMELDLELAGWHPSPYRDKLDHLDP